MGESNARLKQAREAAGYKSARQAALKNGWTPSTYASHENGQTEVPSRAADVYAKAFHTTAAWILFGTGPREASLDARLLGQPKEVWDEAHEALDTILKYRGIKSNAPQQPLSKPRRR
jgi:hypothetical protein